MSSASHSWSPIADLSPDDLAAASDELPALVATWQEQRELMDPRQVERFNDRLAREWAIETGILERIYALDRGTTQLLIERGIDSSLIPYGDTDQSPELVAGIISDQESAVDWLFDAAKQERPLSTSFIRELHALMTRRQEWVDGIDQFDRPTKTPLRHGQYKETANNPSRGDGSVHEYAPPVHVAAEMDRLIELHREHRAATTPPEVEAAWLHHRFTQIHPFQDGNGRVARALASLVLIRAGWFPLVVNRDDRVRYLDALEAADAGALAPLVVMFSSLQKRSLIRALTITDEVIEAPRRVDQMIDAIADRLATRGQAVGPELDQAKVTARRLWEVARARLEEVRRSLEGRIDVAEAPKVYVLGRSDDSPGEDYTPPRDETLNLDLAPNLTTFYDWICLAVGADEDFPAIVVSFSGLGQDFRGVVGARSYFRKASDPIGDTIDLYDEIFQINYMEDPTSVERRFRPWLEEAILRGLDAWRRSL